VRYVLLHLKYVAALPWEMSKIHFHAVLQNMPLKSVSYMLKSKRIMSYGWTDIDIITSVAHRVCYLPQTCLKMAMPFINCTVSNALVSATPCAHFSSLTLYSCGCWMSSHKLHWTRLTSEKLDLIEWKGRCLLEMLYSDKCLVCRRQLSTFRPV